MPEAERTQATKALAAFGWISVAYWLSRAVFPQRIPPLIAMPYLDGLLAEVAPWIRHRDPALSGPDDAVVARLHREVLFAFALQWLLIGAGAASGALIAWRRKAGWAIALALGAAVLLSTAAAQVRLLWQHRLVGYWTVMAQVAPRIAIAAFVQVAFATATLVYLTRRRVRAAFSASRDPGS